MRKIAEIFPQFWFWTVLSISYLLISGYFSVHAPIGYWPAEAFGVNLHQSYSDPDGYYLPGAIEFFQPFETYEGHPGLPLKLLMLGVVRGSYFLNQITQGKTDFYTYCAKNLPLLFVIGRLAMALVHLFSFYVVFRFTNYLLKNTQAALIATFTYATSFPVLMYLSKISVEPMMVIFTLLSFLAVWKFQDAAAEKNEKGAWTFLGLCSFSAIAAIYTKFHLLAPIVLILFVQILVESYGSKIPVSKRLKYVTGFTTFSGLFFWLGTFGFNWQYFFEVWSRYAPGGANSRAATEGLTAFKSLKIFIHEIWNFPLRSYLPQPTNAGLFGMLEWLIIVGAVCGVAMFLRSQSSNKRKLIWPFLFGLAAMPAIIHRGYWFPNWHYLFIHFALATVFFGYAVDRFIRSEVGVKLREKIRLSALVTAILGILVIHQTGIVFYLNSRVHDVEKYREDFRPIFRALKLVRPDQKIALIVNDQDRTASMITDKEYSVPSYYVVDGIFNSAIPKQAGMMQFYEKTFLKVTYQESQDLILLRKENVAFVLDYRSHPEEENRPDFVHFADWESRVKRSQQPVATDL